MNRPAEKGVRRPVLASTNPTPRRPWFFHDKVGLPECPYLERWVLDLRFFSVRLHRWLGSDDQRWPHDHPWSFLTFCFRGAYVDSNDQGEDLVSAPAIRFRRAEHKHMVRLAKTPCWTLLLTGPDRREFGFWVSGKFRKRNRYFFDHGHHPCEPRS